MQVFRKWTRNLTLSIESFLDDIENHAANVAAAIREVERGSIRIRAERASCERRLAALEQSLEALTADQQRWRERAVRVAADREKALECVRRMRAVTRSIESTALQRNSQRALLDRLIADERAVEERLLGLRRRRAELVSREARVVATGPTDAESSAELESVFDRWQAQLEEREIRCEVHREPVDPLAREFDAEEEQRAIELELDGLLQKGGRDGSR